MSDHKPDDGQQDLASNMLPGAQSDTQSGVQRDGGAQMFDDRAAKARRQWQSEMPELSDYLNAMVILGRLNEASHVVLSEKLSPIFKGTGLKQGEFDVLATLLRSGAPYKLMPTDLYKSTMMSSGGMTARLDRLAKAGHIERCPHPSDRRALMVCLTDQGLSLIKSMMPDYVTRQTQILKALPQSEQEMLAYLLGKLVKTLHDGG